MIIEYSNEVRGKIHAYRFSKWEMIAIADGLQKEVKKRMAKIERIRNSPKNEGQATFSMRIQELNAEVEILNETIKEFNNNPLN